jgi:hypothetical protein
MPETSSRAAGLNISAGVNVGRIDNSALSLSAYIMHGENQRQSCKLHLLRASLALIRLDLLETRSEGYSIICASHLRGLTCIDWPSLLVFLQKSLAELVPVGEL